MTPHLTEEQFADLLAAPRNPDAASAHLTAQVHLAECPSCAAELTSMQESLALFREASTALAEAQLRSMPRPALPARRRVFMPQPALWAAAAAMLLVSLAPLDKLRHDKPAPQPVAVAHVPAAAQTRESDEALLRAVDNEISESVPTPMEALADPTAVPANKNSDQRKDYR